MPSIYHIWFHSTLLGQHRRECQLFRDEEPNLVNNVKVNVGYPKLFPSTNDRWLFLVFASNGRLSGSDDKHYQCLYTKISSLPPRPLYKYAMPVWDS